MFTNNTTRQTAAATALFLGVALLTGCNSAKVPAPLLTETLSGTDAESQISFWHGLAERPMVSNDEAFHALMLFMEQNDPPQDYAARVASLQNQGLLPADLDPPADDAIQRGTLAIALARMLRLEGGLALRFLPYSPRYAMRELVYLGLYPPSSEFQTFTGAEFVGVIGKIEDYQNHHPGSLPAKQLDTNGLAADHPESMDAADSPDDADTPAPTGDDAKSKG